MRVRRLLAAVVTAGLVAPAAAIVSTTAPASAAVATSIAPVSTDRPLIYATRKVATYGDNLYSNIDVVAADGSSPYGGVTTVQQQLAGQSTWTTVSTTNGAYASLSNVKARANATYRISWSGSGNWSPTPPVNVSVKVTRDVDMRGISGKAGFTGKVKPKGKVKIRVEKKVGKKWKKFRTFKTKKNGKFWMILQAPRRGGKLTWRFTFVGNKSFTKTVYKGWTRRY